MESIESLGRFELKHDVLRNIIGPATTYTFQLTGDGTAKIYGSLDAVNWVWMAEMTSTNQESDSFAGQHTWRYMKAEITGDAKLYGNRG